MLSLAGCETSRHKSEMEEESPTRVGGGDRGEENGAGYLDLFAVGGQSNAVGRGGASKSPELPRDVGVEFKPTTDNISDPLEDPVGNAETGSAWPAFAKRYHELTGSMIGIVSSAVGGTAQVAAADRGLGNWDKSGNLRSTLVSDVTAAREALESAGYNVRFRGILWMQGTRDAQAIRDGTITKHQYKSALREMISYYDDTFDRWHLCVFETGHPKYGDRDGFAQVREAQRQIAQDQPRAWMVSKLQKSFPEEGWMLDAFHYNQTGLDAAGSRGAERIATRIE